MVGQQKHRQERGRDAEHGNDDMYEHSWKQLRANISLLLREPLKLLPLGIRTTLPAGFQHLLAAPLPC